MSTPPKNASSRKSPSRRKGFTQASSLLRSRIRDASAARGFAQSRLLTHWEEIAGPDTARISRPVEVSYAKGGMGATLVLLTTGAHAPVLEMEKEKLRARVNAVYGYNAISRVRITQTAPTGFAEGKVAFAPAPKAAAQSVNPEIRKAGADKVAPVTDPGLREALERLGTSIATKSNR